MRGGASWRENEEMNRRCVDMADKLGTVVADLVAPNRPCTAYEELGEPFIPCAARRPLGDADAVAPV
jgi:hypothetical protein